MGLYVADVKLRYMCVPHVTCTYTHVAPARSETDELSLAVPLNNSLLLNGGWSRGWGFGGGGVS